MLSLKIKKAFSLIELSIVILVIAVLIAGIVKSGTIINKFNLSSARNLTSNSPVIAIKNLVAWYETTSTNSFSFSIGEEGDAIATWYDINPQTSSKNNATQATSNQRPLYQLSKVTGLPMLYFDGVDDSFLLPDNTIPSANSAFTIFAVNVCICTNGYATIYSAGNWGVTGVNYMRYFSQISMDFRVGSASLVNYLIAPPQTRNVTSIFTGTYNNASGNKSFAFYKNGASVEAGEINLGTNFNTSSTDNFIGRTFGGNNYYGHIGELIIYNRYLKNDERRSIETYLGKKWKMKMEN